MDKDELKKNRWSWDFDLAGKIDETVSQGVEPGSVVAKIVYERRPDEQEDELDFFLIDGSNFTVYGDEPEELNKLFEDFNFYKVENLDTDDLGDFCIRHSKKRFFNRFNKVPVYEPTIGDLIYAMKEFCSRDETGKFLSDKYMSLVL